MNQFNNDISSTELESLVKHFDNIGNEIILEINKKIENLNNSILYKYHTNFFYFIPKHCLLEVKTNDDSCFHIQPNQVFYVEDKKKKNSLKYTPKIESYLLPANKINSRIFNDYIVIDLDLNGNLEYEDITFWADHNFVSKNKYIAWFLIEEILKTKPSSSFAEIVFADGNKRITQISISKLNFQFSPLDLDILKIHATSSISAFNVKIENLFNHDNDKISKITIYIKVSIKNYILPNINDIFMVNIIPIFNSYEDYSYTINTDMQLSEVELKHIRNKYAKAISIISVYENKEKLEFYDFAFKGQNEYYFNLFSHRLNYSTMLPYLNSTATSLRLYAYACWTDDVNLSDSISIHCNDTSSLKYKFQNIESKTEITNYQERLPRVFSLINKIISEKKFDNSTIEDILTILQVNESDIERLFKLVNNMDFDNITNQLIVNMTNTYAKSDYFFVNFIVDTVRNFINYNSPEYIKIVTLNEIRS